MYRQPQSPLRVDEISEIAAICALSVDRKEVIWYFWHSTQTAPEEKQFAWKRFGSKTP